MAPENFLQEYVEEVRDHLQELENSLLNLERDGASGDEINMIFRAAHSIKGASAYMGFEQLANLTHELENLISDIRKSSRPITTDSVSVMLQCVDFISGALTHLEANGAEPPLPQLLLDGIQDALAAGDAGTSLAAEPAAEQAVPEESGASGLASQPEAEFEELAAEDSSGDEAERVLPLDSPVAAALEEDGELFKIYAASFREHFSELIGLLSPETGAMAPEAVPETAGGLLNQMILSSQYMDYGPVVEILNELEASLQEAFRDGDLQDFREVLDRVYACGLRLEQAMPGLDLPLATQSADPGPIPVYVEREEDEELFDIYLDSFRETFGQLDSLIPLEPETLLTAAELAGIEEVIQRLISSSRYMDYDLIANTLEELDQDLHEAYSKGLAAGRYLTARINSLRTRLKAQMPALGDLHPPIEPADGGPKVEIRGELPESMDFLEEIAIQAESLIRELAPDPALSRQEDLAEAEEETGEGPEFPEISSTDDTEGMQESAEGVESDTSGDTAAIPAEKVLSGQTIPRAKKQHGHERIYAVAEDVSSSPTLRVDAQKVDLLLNQVGELVVTRSEFIQTSQFLREFLRELSSAGKLSKQELRKLRALNFRLNESTQSLGRVANDLQDSVMRVRMLPISFLFQRFHRVVRDHSMKVGKQIDLITEGGETEIDKRVLEQMYDPIIQFLRNAIAHGIETPDLRRQASKSETGMIRLAASHQGDYVALEIEDDGNGIDTRKLRHVLEARKELTSREIDRLTEQELLYAIFLPGVSTQDEPDGNAGRGVGLDVAKQNVERMNGSIEVESLPGVGTRFTIRIPLTVAIIRALLVGGLSQTFTIPLTSVAEILRYEEENIHTIEGFEVISLRGKTIPLIHLGQLLNFAGPAISDGGHKSIVIVTTSFREVGLVVDSLLGEREVVIKPLDTDSHDFEGFSGATILGDGTVSLVLDVSSLLRQLKDAFGERRRSRVSMLH